MVRGCRGGAKCSGLRPAARAHTLSGFGLPRVTPASVHCAATSSGGNSVEAHVPAQQSQARQDPRFPRPHAHAWRPGRHPGAPRPRPEASLRLIRRVSDRATFEALAGARRLRVGSVSIRAVRLGASGPPRVAYAIGKRTGSAVVRNRVRRRLRAAVALHEAELAAGGAYLLAADQRAMTAPFVELADQVGRALRQARELLA